MAAQPKAITFPTLGSQLAALAAIASGQVKGERHSEIVAALGADGHLAEDGGFLLKTEWSAELIGSAYEGAIIAPLCDRRTTARRFDRHLLPAISEVSRADGSRWGGAVALWQEDGMEGIPSRPKFKNLRLQSKKLMAFCFTSAELAGDAPALEGHLRRAYRSEAAFQLDLAIVSGSAGSPLGMLRAPALITVAKEVGQAAGTIVGANIGNMWARLPLTSRRRAAWLVDEDIEPKLSAIPDAAANYRPAGSDGIAWPRLYGRPVVAIEQASPLGTVGDIILADPSQYILEDAGEAAAMSIHVHFAKDELIWRFAYYVDGQPGWLTPILPFNGSDIPRSPFVTLAARE